MNDPTPDVPVFKLVRDTTNMTAAERYRLAAACGLVVEYDPPLRAPKN